MEEQKTKQLFLPRVVWLTINNDPRARLKPVHSCQSWDLLFVVPLRGKMTSLDWACFTKSNTSSRSMNRRMPPPPTPPKKRKKKKEKKKKEKVFRPAEKVNCFSKRETRLLCLLFQVAFSPRLSTAMGLLAACYIPTCLRPWLVEKIVYSGVGVFGGIINTNLSGKSYRRRLGSLLLYLCYVFWALLYSLVCCFCTTALGLVLFQIWYNKIVNTVLCVGSGVRCKHKCVDIEHQTWSMLFIFSFTLVMFDLSDKMIMQALNINKSTPGCP